jgi:hypothetical protein
MSVIWSSVAVLSAGLLRDPQDQPTIVQFLVSRTGSNLEYDHPVPVAFAVSCLGFAFFNSVPVSLLAYNPYGPQSLVIDCVYLIVLGLWLARLSVALVRSRSRHRDE